MKSKHSLFVLALVTFDIAFGMKFGAFVKSVSHDQNLLISWSTSPSDPQSFDIDALCNGNVTVSLQTVQKSQDHISIPPSNVSRLPFGSCIFEAKSASNSSPLDSSPTVQVLSKDLQTSPIQSSPDATSSTAAASTTLTLSSLMLTSTPSLSRVDVVSSSLSFSSADPESVAFQSPSSTSVSTQAPEQLTTDGGMSVSGQSTAIMETFTSTSTDSSGKVFTIISQTSVNLGGGLTSVPSGFTAVEKTTTFTFKTGSSTGVTTVTFTTDIPVQSAASSGPASHSRSDSSQLGFIIGGTLGGVVFLALLIILGVVLFRRRQKLDPSQNIVPMHYDPSYTQPPERFVGEKLLPGEIPQFHMEDLGRGCSEDLEALTQEARGNRSLLFEVRSLNVRISQLERERWAYASGEDIRPPDYSDSADSYTYEQQIRHA